MYSHMIIIHFSHFYSTIFPFDFYKKKPQTPSN